MQVNSLYLNSYILMWVFIIGLCLGSFFNVVILRSISGESIVFPPSKCPKCGKRLKPWHNIPVISYLFLRGKCAFCKEKISIQYPIVELVTALLFSLAFIKFGINHITLVVWFSVACLLIMTVTDLREKIVNCYYAIAMAIVGVIYAFCVGGLELLKEAVLGAIIGFFIIELIAYAGKILKKGRAMGEADSYVAGAIGALVGYHDICPILLYSLIASMVFILPMFLYNQFKDKNIITLLFTFLFIISVVLTRVFPNIYWLIVLMGIIGLVLIYMIIKDIRKEKHLNYLPFVPALSAGFLYYIMFVL